MTSTRLSGGKGSFSRPYCRAQGLHQVFNRYWREDQQPSINLPPTAEELNDYLFSTVSTFSSRLCTDLSLSLCNRVSVYAYANESYLQHSDDAELSAHVRVYEGFQAYYAGHFQPRDLSLMPMQYVMNTYLLSYTSAQRPPMATFDSMSRRSLLYSVMFGTDNQWRSLIALVTTKYRSPCV